MPSDIYQADRPSAVQLGSGGDAGTDPAGHDATTTTATTSGGRPRTATTTAEIDTTLIHPGSVRINVKGAFIVDQDNATPRNGRGSPNHHETKDIRLPNHTAVVSHVAVDVCIAWLLSYSSRLTEIEL
jgi:type II pantothenate kinase